MAYDVKVSTGDVATKAQKIQSEASEIEARLSQLSSAMADLANTWTGSAASSFQEMYAGWDRTAKQMKQALDGIGTSLKGAGTDYDSLESKLTSQFK
jgi:WXG100 family type VII secretion target